MTDHTKFPISLPSPFRSVAGKTRVGNALRVEFVDFLRANTRSTAVA